MANRYSVFQLQNFLKHAGDKPKFTCVKKVAHIVAVSSDAFLLKEAYTLVGVRDSIHLGWRVVLRLAKAPKSRELLVSLAEFKRCFTHEGKAFRKDVPTKDKSYVTEPSAFIVSVDIDDADDDDTEQFLFFEKKAAIDFALKHVPYDAATITVHKVRSGGNLCGGDYIGKIEQQTFTKFKLADGTFFNEKV